MVGGGGGGGPGFSASGGDFSDGRLTVKGVIRAFPFGWLIVTSKGVKTSSFR